jgi:hypothetical protein
VSFWREWQRIAKPPAIQAFGRARTTECDPRQFRRFESKPHKISLGDQRFLRLETVAGDYVSRYSH